MQLIIVFLKTRREAEVPTFRTFSVQSRSTFLKVNVFFLLYFLSLKRGEGVLSDLPILYFLIDFYLFYFSQSAIGPPEEANMTSKKVEEEGEGL